jgi:guanosine-3',5'-bis(diphosphate) 3'-pyrophosphohydrolase
MSDDSVSTTILLKAVQFAAVKHQTQRRKDVEASPFINHPIEVAHLLADVGGITDVATLVAAILHDTIEDTETTPGELEEQFGPVVRNVVEEVTDDKTLGKAVRKELQIEHAPTLSRRAKAIKLADKIANM